MLMQEMKKSYKHEKRRMAKKVTSTMLDPAVIILSSWLKVSLSVSFRHFIPGDFDFVLLANLQVPPITI